MPNITTVPLSTIQTDELCQARVKLRRATVREYAAAYADPNVKMPPLTVFADAAGVLWLGDGWHRREALLSLAGPEARVEVEIFDGGKRAAFQCALRANGTHGLPRTNADKRKAVELALADEEMRRMSDRRVAEACGVSHNFVNEVRRELSLMTVGADGMSFDDIREGRDGKVRRLPKRAAKMPTTPMKSPEKGEKIADSTLSPGEGREARPFNVVEAHRELDEELKRLLAKFPRELRHGACVALRNAAIEADPEVQDLTQTAFDELLSRKDEGSEG